MDEESIYNLIPPVERVVQKPPMYRSKHNPRQPPLGSTLCGANGAAVGDQPPPSKKASAGGFGPKNGSRKVPSQYLKKTTATGVDPKSKPAKFSRPGGSRKAAVPKASDAPVSGLHTSKNFIVANAVENILAVPKNTHKAEESFLKKPDYGKRPAYLDDVAAEREMEQKLIAEMQHEYEVEETGEIPAKEISEDERAAMIEALKVKWGDVNKRYQKLAHQTILDTIGKVRRKEMLENELKVIEEDIEKLERHGALYVV